MKLIAALFLLLNGTPHEEGGISQCLGKGPKSYIISLWQDQTSFIASGVPIPAPRGSPAGPNQ